MATNNLNTDYWIESSEPISNLKTDQWNFALTPHPSFTLKTDLWLPTIVPFGGNTYLQTNYLVAADTAGDVQMINIGKDDDGTPIYFELETQELDFGNRAHYKGISDQIQVMSKFADSSALQSKQDGGNYEDIQIELTRRINIGDSVNLQGNFFQFRWYGEVRTQSPILEGIGIERINDIGLTKDA